MNGKCDWIVIITSMLAGVLLGWNARIGATNDQYIRALAEKHEAAARYWDVKTNEILTNNTLNRRKQ